MSHGPEGLYPSQEDRSQALEADRQAEAAPLPYSGLKHYENDGQRQADLAAAERANIAQAAREAGLTSEEWQARRAREAQSKH